MARQLITQHKYTRVSNAVAAGTTAINGNSVDMQGFESVNFEVLFGAITATAVTSVKLQGSNDNATFTDLAGTSVAVADTASNGVVLVECVKPVYRYIRPVVSRGTANAALDGIVAEQYNTRSQPVTQPASIVASEVSYSPAAGTA